MTKKQKTPPKTEARIEKLPLLYCVSLAHPKNPKDHDIDALIASFKRFGFVSPPLIDEATNTMVAGHGRCEALEAMCEKGEAPPSGIELQGTEWLVPVIRGVSFRNATERDAYVIADNQHVTNGGWKLDALTEMLGEIKDAGFDGMGFSPLDLQAFGIGSDQLVPDGDPFPGGTPGDEHAPGNNMPPSGGGNRALEVQLFDHDALLEATIAHYRAHGFPFPDPPLQECMQEINRLASMPLDALVRSTVGYGVADKFQRHRFAVSAENKFSPLHSFNDDDQLRRAIELSLKYEGSLSDGAIRGVISLVRNTQACSNFRPGFAAYLYRRYCPPGGVALDTSTGYGGRLVGALASTVVKHYIGIDPNTPTVEGNRKLLAVLGKSDFATLIESPAEDVEPITLRERCDFAFTSPPYFRKEHYSEDDTQSWKRYPEADSWREKFLVPMMRLQYEALKGGCISAVNIGDVLLDNVRHPLGEWTVQSAKRVGFEHVGTLDFPMSRRFGSNQKDEVATEPVFLFKKP